MDPMHILMTNEDKEAPVQADFYRNVKDIVTSAIEAGYQYKQTVVFKNLCEKTDLEEWNKLQSDDMVKILSVHNIPAPKSATLIDAIRVDYVRIDEVTFHIALIKEMSETGYHIPDYLIAVRQGDIKDWLTKVMELGVEAQSFFKNEVVKRYKYVNVRTITLKDFTDLLKSIVESDMYNNTKEGIKPTAKKGVVDVKKKR